MRNRRMEFILRLKVGFYSWVLQSVFALWFFLLFVVFAKMDYGEGELAQISVEKVSEKGAAVFILPERLILPNPPTK